MQPPRTPDDLKLSGERQRQGSKIAVATEWLSKIPSIFYSSMSQDRDAISSPIKSLRDMDQEGIDGVPRHALQNHVMESEELDAAGEIRRTMFAGNEHSGRELRSGFCGNELTEIEQLLKHKFFSRDESTHLIELIQSRMTEIVNHRLDTGRFTGESVEGIHGQRDQHASRKQEDAFQAPYVGSSLVNPHVSRKQEDAYQSPYVGSSPVEIAKAYMGTLKSNDIHFHNRKQMKENLFSSDKLGSIVPYSVKKSPICWPGATVQHYHGHSSNQSQGGSIRPYNSFQGADSSASLLKSSYKSQGFSRRRKLSDVTSNLGKQPCLPVLEDISLKRRKYSSFAGIMTASPVSHSHKKTSTATVLHEGPWLSNPSASYSSVNTSDALIGSPTTIHKNIMQGSSKVGGEMTDYLDEDDERSKSNIGSAVHPHTSRTARKILEYLDTAVPTPREKSLELMHCLSRMKFSQNTKKVDMEGNGRYHYLDSYNNKSACLVGREAVGHENADMEKIQPGTASGSFCIDQSLLHNQPSHRESSDSGQSLGMHHSSFKPPKPLERCGISENGFCFTFPVPETSGVSSDPPPTPSIRPAEVASKMLDSIEGSDPVYSFGSSAVGKRVVFSLNPILCSPKSEMADINFNFGSVEMQRLSFSSLEDVVCH